MENEKPIRTFLAIELPRDIQILIKGMQERLMPVLREIRWTRPDGIHLTLKFFGDLFQDDVTRISEVVGRLARDSHPMELNIGLPGGFPTLKRPRVLWLGIGGDTLRLTTLQAALEKELEEAGFPGDTRSFKPHLTVGRARSRGGVITGTEAVMENAGKLEASRFDVRELILFKSELKPGGAVYTKVAGFPFRGQ